MTIAAAMQTQHVLCHLKAPHMHTQLLKDNYAHGIHPQAQTQSKPAAAQDQVIMRLHMQFGLKLCQMVYIETIIHLKANCEEAHT